MIQCIHFDRRNDWRRDRVDEVRIASYLIRPQSKAMGTADAKQAVGGQPVEHSVGQKLKYGGVTEWSIVPVLKTGVWETGP